MSFISKFITSRRHSTVLWIPIVLLENTRRSLLDSFTNCSIQINEYLSSVKYGGRSIDISIQFIDLIKKNEILKYFAPCKV